jgi:isoquinoline 1-oxidoreductase subunit beta
MSAPSELSRRAFLRTASTSAVGLLVAFHLPSVVRGTEVAAGEDGASPVRFAPNAWIRIDADGTTTLVVGQAEMGQGVHTALPMILAEELDADWASVRVEQAPADARYGNSLLGGEQLTVGSASVRGFWEPLRKAGATARAMLVAAAAAEWQTTAESLRTAAGTVIHPDGRRLPYGRLTARAGAMAAPSHVPLKKPEEFRLVGKSVPRLDLPLKVNGRATFGIDVQLPGLLTAVVARCPTLGGKVKSVESADALRVPGVRHVVQISSGVAVVADGYWSAKRGRDALRVQWDEGKLATLDSADMRARFATRAAETGLEAQSVGDVRAALAGASKTLEAEYDLPFLDHAPMEPQNATAHVSADRCIVWAPTQGPTAARETAARITGLPKEVVEVHTTLLGGAFGRRAGVVDFVVDAVEASKAIRAPVKVIWSREDDLGHGAYRPMSYHRLAAGLDASGRPTAWTHTIVTPSIFGQWEELKGVDGAAVGGARGQPYVVPNVLVRWIRQEDGVPLGTWRSVGNSANTFVVEGFIDELAAAAGIDPYRYRHQLLEGNPRLRTVLELAAEKAEWGTPLPPGRGRGIGLVRMGGSVCAQIAEVSVGSDDTLRVHRVVCAVDCGIVVNPDGLRAQVEGGIMFGLSAALSEAITIRQGRVEQSNFHDYPILRIDAAPRIDVHIVASGAPPTGAGEFAVPPIAPAVANAIHAATGARVRALPFSKQRLRRA